MYRRIPVMIIVILVLLSGCSGRQSGQGEELTELTDVVSEEEAKDEAIEDTKEEPGEEAEELPQGGIQDAGGPSEVYVHVCGQVASPGVYKLPLGSRMFEAVEAAGGLLPEAADDFLNQAAQVEDGQQIYVPSREEALQTMADPDAPYLAAGIHNAAVQGTAGSHTAAGSGQAPDGGKIDLNTASKEQLMTLSGIGEAKAGSIIAYREAHGGFQRIEELMEVEGIKEGVFNKVKDQIKVL